MLEDRLQDLDSSTCDIFQLYFYDNLFNPDENSKIQNSTRLNELFNLNDQSSNEKKLRQYVDEIGITIH